MNSEGKVKFASILAFMLFSLYAVIRYSFIRSIGFLPADTTIFTLSLESALEGKFFYNPIEEAWYGVSTHFGVHNQPILFLILPFFLIWRSPYLLLIMQAFAVAFSSIFFYKFASLYLDEKRAAGLTFLFLLHPTIHSLVTSDFVPENLGPLFIFAFVYTYKTRPKVSVVPAMLLLSVKEDAGLFIISYALLEAILSYKFSLREWISDRRIVGMFLLGGAGILVGLAIIGHFSGSGLHVLESYSQKPPFIPGAEVETGKKLLFLFVVFSSFGFLHLLRPDLLVASIPLWMEIMIAGYSHPFKLGSHYHYMLFPFLWIIIVHVLKERPSRIRVLSIATLLSIPILSPILALKRNEILFVHPIWFFLKNLNKLPA